MTWIEEIISVAEACGCKHVHYPNRGGIECVGITYDEAHFVSHISEDVWKYLKEHGDAENWLTLWLKACEYSRSQR